MWRVAATEATMTNENTTVFGTTNPKRCPVRSENTILTGSESISDPPISTPGHSEVLAVTIKNMIHQTTSATYTHPMASTILTDNGFFIPHVVYQISFTYSREWRSIHQLDSLFRPATRLFSIASLATTSFSSAPKSHSHTSPSTPPTCSHPRPARDQPARPTVRKAPSRSSPRP